MISAKNLLVISRVRLARLGRQVLILEIMGSNPIRGTDKKLSIVSVVFYFGDVYKIRMGF